MYSGVYERRKVHAFLSGTCNWGLKFCIVGVSSGGEDSPASTGLVERTEVGPSLSDASFLAAGRGEEAL